MDTLDLNVCYEQLGFIEAPFQITPDTDYFFDRRNTCEPWRIYNLALPVVS